MKKYKASILLFLIIFLCGFTIYIEGRNDDGSPLQIVGNETEEELFEGRTSNFWRVVGGKLQTVNDRAINITGDLEFTDEIKPDGATCSNGQILKKTGADNWDCAADGGGGYTFATTTEDYHINNTAGIITLDVNGTIDVTGQLTSATINNSGIATTTELCFADGTCQSTVVALTEDVVFYYYDTDAIYGYELMESTPAEGGEDSDSCVASQGYCDLGQYITATSTINTATWPAGTWHFDTFYMVSSDAGDSRLVIEVYSVTTGGAETLQFQATSTEINNGTINLLEIQATTVEITTSDPSDRMIVKLRGWTDAVAGKTITYYYQGTQYYSHVHTTFGSSIDLGSYAQTNVAETITANWINTANPWADNEVADNITIDLADTATALAANGANCNAGEYALGIDASGAVESCTDATTEINTEIGNVLDGTDTFTDFTGNDIIDTDNLNWGGFTDLGESGVVTWSNLASGELTSEVLIIGTDVKAGTLTDTKLCKWDSGNTQIVCDQSGLTASSSILTVSQNLWIDGSGILDWGTGTTTGENGIDITTGCYAIGGTCISGSGGSGDVGTGVAGQVPYYETGGTSVAATSSIFIDDNQNVGIGTTTPLAQLVVGDYGGTTSTLEIGADAIPSCLKLQDTDGAGFTYGTVLNGTMTWSTNSCNP